MTITLEPVQISGTEFDKFYGLRGAVPRRFMDGKKSILLILEPVDDEPPPLPSLDILKAGDEGIDVSRWQGAIDWPRVPKRFMYARVGAGFTADATFTANWTGAKAAGILRGAYLYFVAGAAPDLQAKFVIDALKADGGELPLCIDVEPRAGETVDKARATASIKNVLELCEFELGYRPIIYTNRVAWEAMTTSPEWAADYTFWLARYSSQPPPQSMWPRYVKTVRLWQYSNAGAVAGIAGAVDLDRVV